MKIKTATTLVLLAIFCLGGKAQKPERSLRGLPGDPLLLLSEYDIRAGLQAGDKNAIPYLHALSKNVLDFYSTPDQRLKAEQIETTYSEKLDSLVDWSYDTVVQAWQLDEKEYYYYDVRGRNYSYISSYYNPQLLTMIPEERADIRFTNDDRMAGKTYYYWESDGEFWIPDYTDTTSFAGDGKVMSMVMYYYDEVLLTWIPDVRMEYSYIGDILDKENIFYWIEDPPGWENSMESNHYYDEFGRDTSKIDYYWDGESWYETFRTTKQYDASGNLILQEEWSFNGEVWYGYEKRENTYEGDRLISSLIYEWDYDLWMWFIYEKYEFAWDAQGNLLEEIYSYYDTANKIFIPEYKDLYEYDYSREIADIAMPYFWTEGFEDDAGIDFSAYVNKIIATDDLVWNPAKGDYDFDYRDSVYYSSLLDVPVNDVLCRADFSWRLDDKDDQLVYFTDKSDTTVVSWYWMFGDGQSSTQQNPKHTYANPGTYRVVLTTVDKTGFCSNTMVKQIKVGSLACNAAFSVLVDTLLRQITLINESEGTNLRYFWDFGDGSVDKTKDPPVHVYTYPGSYTITLTVSDDLGNCMDRYVSTVRVAQITCNADFAVFVDSSTNGAYFRAKQILPGNRYQWILGDGTVAKTPNYVHKFPNSGFYSAELKVINDEIGCVETRKETFLVGKKSPGGKADFIYVCGEGNTVAFTNQSLGSELTYHWDFNDGNTSKEKSPENKYALAGYYDVCLTVTTKDGLRNTHCEKIFAGESSKYQCLAWFEYLLSNDGLNITCEDRSFGDPDQWLWTYDDGWTATDPIISWSTETPRHVRIQETIRNTTTGCRDDAFALVNMGAESEFKASFGYIVDESGKKAGTYPTDFVGISLGDAGKLKWDFDDGSYDSTSINPTHIYTQPGEYNVCLTITNTSTGEEDTYCEIVKVGPVSSPEDISSNGILKSYPNPFKESSRIDILLENNSEIDLSVYDLMGRKILTLVREFRPAGSHTFRLEGSRLEAGNYYLVLDTEAGRSRQLISVIR